MYVNFKKYLAIAVKSIASNMTVLLENSSYYSVTTLQLVNVSRDKQKYVMK